MFTAIRVLFNLVGANLSDSTIRMALIAGIILAVLAGGFFFRHEIQSFVASKVYAVELQHNQAIDDAQIKILQDQLADQQAAITKLTQAHASVQVTTDRLTSNITLGGFKTLPVGPATQQTIDGLRQIWPVQPPTPVPVPADQKLILPSISAWLAHKGAANAKTN